MQQGPRPTTAAGAAAGFVLFAIAIFVVAVSAVGFWKYSHYRYQGLDLAIYTNILYNLAHGDGWWSSIQGASYLGDHIEPILLAIAPLFRLWADPRLLIILQALALGLTAIPVYLLLSSPFHQNARCHGEWRCGINARSVIASNAPLPLSALWLLNPLLWNAALFEFHALAFAPLFLLSAAYCYIRRRFWWFLLWLLLSLSVREDVTLIVMMFGVIAIRDWWRERRSASAVTPQPQLTRKIIWAVVPCMIGLAWFLIATRIAASHSPAGSYKFATYYNWLNGASPLDILRHLMSLGNLDMALGLLLPFLFLPLLRPHWLLLALTPFLQFVLAAGGGSNLVVELHYGLLFVPALLLSTVEMITYGSRPREEVGARPRRPTIEGWFAYHFPLPRRFAITLGIAVYLAAAVIIGPFPGIAKIVARDAPAEDRARTTAYDDLLRRVPSDAPIAAGYAALPHVAARREAFNLAYAYLGVNQYGFAPYALPDNVRHLVLDQRDALAYAVQFPNVKWAAPHAVEGPERLRSIIQNRGFGVVAERDGVALLEHGIGGPALDERYMEADRGVRGRMIVDGLRDITLQLEGT